MRCISAITGFVVILLGCVSCSHLKSSLSKSDDKTYNQVNYGTVKKDTTAVPAEATSKPEVMVSQKAVSDKKVVSMPVSADNNVTDQPIASSQALLNRYAEMDKLAALVQYELDIIDKRREVLIEKFRSASPTEREKLSAELNGLDTNQTALYKAYVKIYRDGKSDWQNVSVSVKNTLLSLRGIGNN